MEDSNTENVLNMRSKAPIFSPELKSRMVLTMTKEMDNDQEKAQKAVDNMENVICSHLILKLRETGEKLGHYLGIKFSEFLGL